MVSIQKMQFLGRRKMDKVLPSHLRRDSDRESFSFWELEELSENIPIMLPRHFSQSYLHDIQHKTFLKVSSSRVSVLCNMKGRETETN